MINFDLNCQYGDFNLKVKETLPSDKIIGLFGKSGCGKSRLLRQVLGFDLNFQKESHLQFNSEIWQDKPNNLLKLTENRGIGYLPQSIDLFPHLNVKENITFSFKDKDIDNVLYQHIIAELNIEALTIRFPSQLSGGQKQRVGLARAMLTAKNLLVLDEPFSAIGEDHKPTALRLVKTFQQSKGLPIIYTSHNRYEHAYLTDYLLCMNNGKVTLSENYSVASTDITNGFSQEPDAINHIEAVAVDYNQEYSINQLNADGQILWVGHSPLEKNARVNLEVQAKDISISLNPIQKSSMLNSIETELIDFFEISHYQYLLKLKFSNKYLIAFITKKSFIELNCRSGLTLYAAFKTVSVISI